MIPPSFDIYLPLWQNRKRISAPVAQRIEHRPPKPGAQVRVLAGASLIVLHPPIASMTFDLLFTKKTLHLSLIFSKRLY